MPCALAGIPIRKDLRGPWGFFAKGDTFENALNSFLMREGGDFRNARFTADTVIRVSWGTANNAMPTQSTTQKAARRAEHYSTAEGQKRLMRESVGQPAHFERSQSSGFKVGQTLDYRDLNLRHPSNRVQYLRDSKPEGGHAVIVVKHRSGVSGEWLARDFQAVTA